MVDELKRRDGDMNDFEALLLAAGKKDGPSAMNRARVLNGLGIASSLPALVAVNAEQHSLGWLRRGVRFLSKPWTVGGIGAAAVAGGIALSGPAPSFAERPAPAPAVSAPRELRAITARAPEVAPAATVAPSREAPESESAARATTRRSATSAPRIGAASDESSTLARELAELDVARKAVAAREPRRALRVLDDYARRFPKPHLPTEATVLRIEALVASGDRARARRLGEALLIKQPNGPYERRVRSLIGDPKRSAP